MNKVGAPIDALLHLGDELFGRLDPLEAQRLDLALEALNDPAEDPLLDRALPRETSLACATSTSRLGGLG